MASILGAAKGLRVNHTHTGGVKPKTKWTEESKQMVREFQEEFKPGQIIKKKEGETEAAFWKRAKRHTESAAKMQEHMREMANTPGVSTFEVKHRKELASFHPLFDVFVAAIDQCTHGKGERHGGCATPFLAQPWAHYAKLHGRGFLTGQAAKKLEEAASTREGEAFINEMLGALVYIGMAILNEQEKMKNDNK